MKVENKDVEDLYKELDEALNDDSGEDTPGASAEDDKGEDGAPAADKKVEDTPADGAEDDQGSDEFGGMTEKEFDSLTPRAQKRIRDLAARLKDGKPAEDKPADDKPADDKKPEDVPAEFNTIEDFLAAVKDEPSRKLLEMFAKVIDKSQSSKIAPLLEKSASELFDAKFTAFEKIDGMAAHKEDLRKTFMRTPTTDLESLVGSRLLAIQMGKIKPGEKKPSTPSHDGGKVDLSAASKDDLYGMLEGMGQDA